MVSIIILYYNIIILWDHHHIRGPSLTETSLSGAYLYLVNYVKMNRMVLESQTGVIRCIPLIFVLLSQIYGGTRCLRHCATSRKVIGSILDGVIGIFHLRHSSGQIMFLGSTQHLTEMKARNISWGAKVAGA